MGDSAVREALLESHIAVSDHVTGNTRSSMKVGGPLFTHVLIADLEVLANIYSVCKRLKTGPLFLGAGSNLVISSSGVRRLVLELGKSFNYCRPLGGGEFEIGGSTPLPSLSLQMTRDGFTGLEFAAGIPGTVGGGIRMNCGAHQNEISKVVRSVKTFSFNDGTFHEYRADSLHWSYRHVDIPETDYIVCAVLSLQKIDMALALDERQRCLEYRKKTQPLTLPSAGSIFRNPEGTLSAGALIERCELKGFEVGGAQISTLHANWIVNPERTATSADVQTLVTLCQAKVATMFGVKLKPELVFW